ncbi:gamma-glutamyltransferase [Bosea vestrisii]|nr:gamma-glutamyltransferase [Bosea vestrisii]WID95228.1 gamma-glutamyltransferase [Bosea vestrisii]
MERIARGGSDVFYHGELADEIAADMAENGGLLTKADLQAYRVSEKDPIWGSYRGRRVASTPPATGGISLIELLQILEAFDIGAFEHGSAEHIIVLAEAMKRVTLDREAHMGDPEFIPVPMDMLLSQEHARKHAESIKRGERAKISRSELPGESRDTTTVSVMDAEGNAVTITHTLGSPSGAISPGLGFMFNGTMAGFDPRPGRAGSIAPGKARGSTMAPSVVYDGDEPILAIGAPGGTYIVPAIAQALSNVFDFGMTMQEAVSAPRVVCLSDKIDVANRIARRVSSQLEAQGYPVARSYQSYAFGAPHGILRQDGRWQGGADPQRDGMAVGVRDR